MPEKPLKHYSYYAVVAQGQVLQLPMQAFGATPPAPEQLEALYQAVYQQAVKQGKLNLPRPTHFKADVLHELPKPKEAARKPASIFLPGGRNGVA